MVQLVHVLSRPCVAEHGRSRGHRARCRDISSEKAAAGLPHPERTARPVRLVLRTDAARAMTPPAASGDASAARVAQQRRRSAAKPPGHVARRRARGGGARA